MGHNGTLFASDQSSNFPKPYAWAQGHVDGPRRQLQCEGRGCTLHGTHGADENSTMLRCYATHQALVLGAWLRNVQLGVGEMIWG